MFRRAFKGLLFRKKTSLFTTVGDREASPNQRPPTDAIGHGWHAPPLVTMGTREVCVWGGGGGESNLRLSGHLLPPLEVPWFTVPCQPARQCPHRCSANNFSTMFQKSVVSSRCTKKTSWLASIPLWRLCGVVCLSVCVVVCCCVWTGRMLSFYVNYLSRLDLLCKFTVIICSQLLLSWETIVLLLL